MKETRFGCIHFIAGANGSRYPFCNSLFIEDDIRAIIDPGSDAAILRKIAGDGGVDIIINSHYHEDHISMNYLFEGASLAVPREEAPCFSSIDSFFDFYGLHDEDYRRYWQQLMLNEFNYRERVPDRPFANGDIFDFGNTIMEVVHTPGHTIGHSSFYFPREDILFLGDLDMTRFGPWYGDRVSDIDQTIESVHRLLDIEAGIHISSHETGIIEGDLRGMAEEYLAVIDTRERALLDFLDKPRLLDEIVHQWIIYKKPRQPEAFFELGERGMIQKHLERLIKNGTVTGENDRYCLR
ncbi:MAG: MBL fold metallo-hydrolase [Deltaproteobacteria bacterium]|nr:MBL fold metallo-hydrolase [Deltaproteobacteria bacterium]